MVVDAIRTISERQLSLPESLRKKIIWLSGKVRGYHGISEDAEKQRHDRWLLEYRLDEKITRTTYLGGLSTLELELIANAHLDELSQRGVIREAADKKLDAVYLAEESIFEQP
jgi:hypothetical protein